MVERMKEAVAPSMRAFVLDMCMHGKVIVNSDLRELNQELRYQGNNLNQLTKLCHQGIETGINNSALTQMLSNKNEYCFDTHFVKKILKDSVTIWGSNYFKQECVLWLDN